MRLFIFANIYVTIALVTAVAFYFLFKKLHGEEYDASTLVALGLGWWITVPIEILALLGKACMWLVGRVIEAIEKEWRT